MHFLNEQPCLTGTFPITAIVILVVLIRCCHFCRYPQIPEPQFLDTKQADVPEDAALNSLKLKSSISLADSWVFQSQINL